MLSRIRNMRGDPVNSLRRVQDEQGGARPRVGRGSHGQGSVGSLPQRVHGHGRARDIAGLRLQ